MSRAAYGHMGARSPEIHIVGTELVTGLLVGYMQSRRTGRL